MTDTAPLEHYAEAFSAFIGRCFRLIRDPHRGGQPIHCPHQVRWRGVFRDAKGKAYVVTACAGHVHDVENPVELG